jgi:hypothetical protein
MGTVREEFRNVGFGVDLDRTDGQHDITLTTTDDKGRREFVFYLTSESARTLGIGIARLLDRIQAEHGRR